MLNRPQWIIVIIFALLAIPALLFPPYGYEGRLLNGDTFVFFLYPPPVGDDLSEEPFFDVYLYCMQLFAVFLMATTWMLVFRNRPRIAESVIGAIGFAIQIFLLSLYFFDHSDAFYFPVCLLSVMVSLFCMGIIGFTELISRFRDKA